jgi:hypothetical protein
LRLAVTEAILAVLLWALAMQPFIDGLENRGIILAEGTPGANDESCG